MNFNKNINLSTLNETTDVDRYNNLKNLNDLYESIEVPFCILDRGLIIHANNNFKNSFFKDNDDNLDELFESISITDDTQTIHFNKALYSVKVHALKTEDDNQSDDTFMLLFYEDVHRDNLKNISSNQICVCYVLLDNYEEALENVEDVKIPLILAIVERRLNAFASSINGIIRKYEKDRYMIIFTKEQLNELKSNNFEIQKQIKEIGMGIKMPLTISVGIGHTSESLSQLSAFAWSALELALGRGGDQVVIKNETEYEYFGESRREADKNSRVKARVKAYALSELLLDYDKVLIMGHVNPDLDCLGASIGVYKIVHSINSSCKCNIIFSDDVSSSVSGLYNALINDPTYKEDVFINNKTALQICDDKTLVIVVDVFRKSITQCPEILDICSDVVIFDHHRQSQDHIRGEILLYHDSAASSTCELITEMMMYIKSNVKLSHIEAESLLAGITVDTKGFTFKTSAKTFDCASYLKKKGADSHNVHIFLQNDFDIYKAKSTAVNNATVYKDICAFTTVTDDVENPTLVVAQTADELLNLTNIKSSIVFYELEECVIVSLRSFGDLNVQLIAESFGGGGHRTVAACRVKDMSIEEITSNIKNQIDLLIEEDL